MKQPHANHHSLPGPKRLAWADEDDSNDAEEGRCVYVDGSVCVCMWGSVCVPTGEQGLDVSIVSIQCDGIIFVHSKNYF